jgi:hypothetical protein
MKSKNYRKALERILDTLRGIDTLDLTGAERKIQAIAQEALRTKANQTP